MRVMPDSCPLLSLRMNLTDPYNGDVIKRCGLYVDAINPQNPLLFRDGSHVLVLEAVFDNILMCTASSSDELMAW